MSEHAPAERASAPKSRSKSGPSIIEGLVLGLAEEGWKAGLGLIPDLAGRNKGGGSPSGQAKKPAH